MKNVNKNWKLCFSLSILTVFLFSAFALYITERSESEYETAIQESTALILSDRLAEYNPSLGINDPSVEEFINDGETKRVEKVVATVDELFDEALHGTKFNSFAIGRGNKNFHTQELNSAKINLLAEIKQLSSDAYDELDLFTTAIATLREARGKPGMRPERKEAFAKLLQILAFSDNDKLRLHAMYHLADISDRLWMDFSLGTPALLFIGVIQHANDKRIAEAGWVRLKGLVGFHYGGSSGIAEPHFWREVLMILSHTNDGINFSESAS